MNEKALEIMQKMEKIFPNPKVELDNWETPFQFIVCIALSAQTTDKQVNSLTKKLFEKYPTHKEMMVADVSEVEKYIGGVNYYRNKAKYLVALANMLEDAFDGVVPQTEKELVMLPGVGRKTAHVFLNDYYKANLGIAVDTHVMRVAQRMGLTTNTNPDKIGADLEAIYPQDIWYKVNLLFVLYGRYVCKARIKPEESECVLKEYCSHCAE